MTTYNVLRVKRDSVRAIIILLVLALPLLFNSTASADEGGREPAAPPQNTIVHGAHIPPIWQNNTEIDAYNSLVGKDAGIVMSFYPWDRPFEDFTCGFFDNTYRHRDDGGTPGVNECMKDFAPNTPEIATTYMIAWEPIRNPSGNLACNVAPGNRTDLNAIINGSCNAYIDNYAARLKAWHDRFGDRFMILFLDEMNISDAPWWRDDAGYPERYKQAFRYVVNRFRAQGATSEIAAFVWSPNYEGHPARDWNVIPNYYPGDQYVDWIGVTGFNWYGTGGQSSAWRTFDSLFVDPVPGMPQGVLPYFHCTYAKPIVLTEFASVEGPGGALSKAGWISDAYDRMLDFPHIRAAVWFNDYANSQPGQADFRATHGSADMDRGNQWPPAPGWAQSLGAPTNAYRAAIGGNRYIDTVPPLNTITPATTYCGTFPPIYIPPTVSLPDTLLVEAGTRVTYQFQGQNIQGTYTLSLSNVTSGLNVQISPTTITPTNPNATITIQVPEDRSTAQFTINGTGVGLEPFSRTVTLRIYDTVYQTYLPVVRD